MSTETRDPEARTTGVLARSAGRDWLAGAMRESRADTLATFAAYERSLPDLAVPRRESLNPPLWELGHIGWFQEYWLARNPARREGVRADPELPRRPGIRDGVDGLYDSSAITHARRWTLPLPDATAVRGYLDAGLEASLSLLARADEDDASLYFFRLALLHEDMHHEAALYMARHLGIPVADTRWSEPSLPPPPPPLRQPAGTWLLGSTGADFAFDNELVAHEVPLAETEIDAQVLRWADYLPFAEAGGYREPRWWSSAGRAWLAAAGADAPRYLRRDGSGWLHAIGGPRSGGGTGGRATAAPAADGWEPLDPSRPACHLTFFEAEAWCAWAGRRLPTEAEWERAAMSHRETFRWGDAWEWTASPFAPFPGFSPHPYRDYSRPWFGSRQVLRGASFMTQPRMRHPRYRNYFPPHRNDVPAGFRSCAA